MKNENKHEFVVGISDTKCSYLTIAEFEDESNKIKLFDLFNFDDLNSENENKFKIMKFLRRK